MTNRQARYLSRFLRLLGASSILLGCFILSLPFLPILIPIQPQAATPAAVAVASAELSGFPIRIIMPSLELSVPLFAVPYTDERWTIPTGGAAVLTTPEAVGARGQVIYGHNWKSILGDLVRTKVGDVIAVEFANGQRRLYTATIVTTTDANDRAALAQGSENGLVLYSCTGWLDSKRVVVVAEPLQ